MKEEDFKERAKQSTTWMQTSHDPEAVRLRALLDDRGLRADEVLLIELFPDDVQFLFGLLITPDRRCIQFGMDYLHKPVDQAVFTEWEDLTGSFSETPYRDQFVAGLELLWQQLSG